MEAQQPSWRYSRRKPILLFSVTTKKLDNTQNKIKCTCRKHRTKTIACMVEQIKILDLNRQQSNRANSYLKTSNGSCPGTLTYSSSPHAKKSPRLSPGEAFKL